MLARVFRAEKIPFTWNEKYKKNTAWKASTGCIYPTGNALENDAYEAWRDSVLNTEWHGLVEEGAFWFITKNPPHKGDYKIKRSVGPLNLGAEPSFHLNVQEFVKSTRKRFEEYCVEEYPGKPRLIISHGYHKHTFDHYQWGWSADATLKIDKSITSKSEWRPCFYLRRGRVTPLVYAYPKPGTPFWYAGSYMLNVKEPRSYEVEPKAEIWAKNVEKLTDGLVKVINIKNFREGWRPCGKQRMKMVEKRRSTIFVRPQEGSGVRMAPVYCQAVLELLR